jgi:hypothetical protein
MSDLPVIEHGDAGRTRWLRERRLKIALGLAIVEGLLVAVDVIPAWIAIVFAIAALGLYFWWARALTAPSLRDTAWVIAVWQAVVLLVPVLVVIVGTLALVAVAAIAVLALVALFADRR